MINFFDLVNCFNFPTTMDFVARSIGFSEFSGREQLEQLLSEQQKYMNESEKFIEQHFSDHGTTRKMLCCPILVVLKK